MNRLAVRRSLAPMAALVSFATFAAPASAQSREELLGHPRANFESPQHFALEARATLYRPDIDSEPGLAGKTPFADTFGDSQRFMPGFELDWQAFRVPHAGTVGLGFGASYASYSSKAKISGTTVDSEEATGFTVVPMHLALVLRGDVVAREIGIPLVPYVKGGLGMGLWFATTDTGLSRTRDASNNVTSTGRGVTWGFHGAIGIMLLLDFFDQGTARNFDNTMGVNHTYLFAELTQLQLSGLAQTNALRIGNTSFSMGLAFEF